MLNFAYGSNMLISKLQRDAPSAKNLGVATLSGYKLCWHKPSAKDHYGKCDISLSDKDSVHGVLYEIAEDEMAALDKTEGGYVRKQINVEHSGGIVRAWVLVSD